MSGHKYTKQDGLSSLAQMSVCKIDTITSDDIVEECGSGINGENGDEVSSAAYNEPSLHEIVQKATATSWKKIRQDLRRAVVESNCMPLHQCCKICGTREATCRCLQCSPCAYFCSDCFIEIHSKAFFFHTGEIWEVLIT